MGRSSLVRHARRRTGARRRARMARRVLEPDGGSFYEVARRARHAPRELVLLTARGEIMTRYLAGCLLLAALCSVPGTSFASPVFGDSPAVYDTVDAVETAGESPKTG